MFPVASSSAAAVPAAFATASAVDEDGMRLGLAPALTPRGLVPAASFFHGFLTRPQVYARGLLVLAEITRTRYFQYTPSHLRDPVFTAHGDRLRAEVFSACNGVTARLDLEASAVDGGEIGHGTTNVDLGTAMTDMLARVRSADLMHLDIGADEVTVSTLARTASERKVEMPARWIPAFGNVAGIHRGFTQLAAYDAATTRRILALLPVTARSGADAHWITLRGRIPRVSDRPAPGAVRIPAAHRLVAARRLLTHLTGMEVYGDPDAGRGVVVEFLLPDGRLSLGLTEQAWRGFSGEGALLVGLTAPQAAGDADLISALLAFEPRIEVPRLMREAHLPEQRVLDALAVLAADGRVGWDLAQQAYFHRELPHDPARVERDHPRVRSARRLAHNGSVHHLEESDYWVRSEQQETVLPGVMPAPPQVAAAGVESGAVGYRVQLRGPGEDVCSCPWMSREGTSRGPCKHILAAHLVAGDLKEQLADAPTSAPTEGEER